MGYQVTATLFLVLVLSGGGQSTKEKTLSIMDGAPLCRNLGKGLALKDLFEKAFVKVKGKAASFFKDKSK